MDKSCLGIYFTHRFGVQEANIETRSALTHAELYIYCYISWRLYIYGTYKTKTRVLLFIEPTGYLFTVIDYHVRTRGDSTRSRCIGYIFEKIKKIKKKSKNREHAERAHLPIREDACNARKRPFTFLQTFRDCSDRPERRKVTGACCERSCGVVYTRVPASTVAWIKWSTVRKWGWILRR